MNLITVAVVTGFQQEVRQKVSGFGSHIFIMGGSESSIYETSPIRIQQPIMDQIRKDNAIKSVSPVAYKPVLFQSDKNEITYQLPNGKDTSEIQQKVFGGVIKGVNDDYDWQFFERNLVSGNIPKFGDSLSNRILISQTLSDDLNYSVGDTVRAFFVRNQPVMRNFVISGIYHTGLEQFDKKIVLSDLRYVQQLNDWGIHVHLELNDTLSENGLITFTTHTTGGNEHYRFDWGKGFQTYSGTRFYPSKDTVIRVIAGDYWSSLNPTENEATIPDTAYVRMRVEGDLNQPFLFDRDENGDIIRTYLNTSGTHFSIGNNSNRLILEFTSGKGSSHNYVGGFEITIKDWTKLDETYSRLEKKVEFIPTTYDEILQARSIKETEEDIFVWLGFLDINVFIILTLMILIGIINMGSALLVLILIRSNFIGMMKAMGATNWKVRKIFLIQAGYLIGRGMLIGNVVGLSICFLQSNFGILPLNPEVYYLSQVPIELNIWHWLLLNIGTLAVCLSALIIPSIVISRISPVKAIKFD